VPPASPRPYRQKKRAETALETRRKVVAAARELLLKDDLGGTSLDAIATRAGVGRSTIYQQFESKRGLLQAVELDVSERAGVENLLQVLSQADALASLRAAFEIGCGVWQLERDLFRKLFGLANVDAELSDVMRSKDQKRLELVRILVDKLGEQRCLRAGLSRARACQVLWLLTSFQSFDACCQVADSPEAAARLLLQLCEDALLTENSGKKPRPRAIKK
jgi:AcrR family transcriptional regulator